ncbi:ClpXP protease specificity-enhancing factor [Marilutibacter chinensis]|uniref:ClpXP protease specificity-enhancing factor n=1 Tax=Marilutibacter chinensis TaxID=2912247 RepID=A0ABS9HW40_9GAMM|nr:ClpXP protease specificity-enhancing factor [Lysobacter chinensis]MCF7222365.1 ClpXP protease specificity-enhancing factor [Lysobacter chinensis]
MPASDSPPMTSHRPYLLRALYEWIADNGMTPHLLVDATRAGVQVPLHAVKEGRIILNVAERAVSRLEMGNELIRFSARFGGVSHAVVVPVEAVLAIYSRETGQGMALPEDAAVGGDAPTGDESDTFQESGGSDAPEDSGQAPATTPSLSAVPGTPSSDDDDDTPPSAPRRTGHLRIVK